MDSHRSGPEMTTIIIRFLGLWIFSLMVWLINRDRTPCFAEDARRSVEELIEAGEIELEEATPDFVEGLLMVDMTVRTALVTIFCMFLWSFVE